jgi:hypothetical protein
MHLLFYLRLAVMGKSSSERAEAKFKKACGLEESAIHEGNRRKPMFRSGEVRSHVPRLQ